MVSDPEGSPGSSGCALCLSRTAGGSGLGAFGNSLALSAPVHRLSWGTAGLAAPQRHPVVAKGSLLGWGWQLPGSSPWSRTLCLRQAAPAPWGRAVMELGRLSPLFGHLQSPQPSLQLRSRWNP